MKAQSPLQDKSKERDPEKPLVSVITVVLNGKNFIQQTIDSIRDQSYRNIEYIVIDGGSTDGTLEILKNNEDVIDQWISENDSGIFDAMNKGIALAHGEIIGILNADDYYLPDAIGFVVDADFRGQADIYYGDILLLTNDKQERMHPDITKMDEQPSIFHPACFVKKTVYEQAGSFDTRFRISSDYEFLLRCIRKNFRFAYVPQALTAFRPGGMSASCASNIEGYHIMKMHKTGHHRSVIFRAIKCYIKSFIKKVINLNRS